MKRFCVNCNALVEFDASTCSACGKSRLVIQHSPKDSKKAGPTVNLSCGRCIAIRPFTLSPPTCTVCDWILGTSAKNHTTTESGSGSARKSSTNWKKFKEDLSTAFWKLVLWPFILVLAYLGYWYFIMPEQDKVADQYHISKDKVVIEPKPHGCDFDDAPLGNKHCHYEKIVDEIKACEQPSCRITGVYVSWKKVEE